MYELAAQAGGLPLVRIWDAELLAQPNQAAYQSNHLAFMGIMQTCARTVERLRNAHRAAQELTHDFYTDFPLLMPTQYGGTAHSFRQDLIYTLGQQLQQLPMPVFHDPPPPQRRHVVQPRLQDPPGFLPTATWNDQPPHPVLQQRPIRPHYSEYEAEADAAPMHELARKQGRAFAPLPAQTVQPETEVQVEPSKKRKEKLRLSA